MDQDYKLKEYARRKLRESLFGNLEVKEPKVCKTTVPVPTPIPVACESSVCSSVATSTSVPVSYCVENDDDDDCPSLNTQYSPYGDCNIKGKLVLQPNNICNTLCYKDLTKAMSIEQEAKQNLQVYSCPKNKAKYEIAKDDLICKQNNMIEYLLKKKTSNLLKEATKEVQDTQALLTGGQSKKIIPKAKKRNENDGSKCSCHSS